jgi:hypothetical protein
VVPGGRGGYRWSLAISGNNGTSFVAEAENASDRERKRMLVYKKAFVDTYNATQGWQAVQVQQGELPFRAPGASTPTKPKKGGQR